MVEKVVNITVTQKGAEKAIGQVSQLNNRLNGLKETTSSLGHGMKGTGNAILETAVQSEKLNSVTNGLSGTLASVADNSTLFSKGIIFATGVQKVYTLVVGSTTGALKALRIALVSTGLGAIVVLLGLFISKMMESTEATEEQKRQQELLNDVLKETNALYKESITDLQDVTKERILRAKIAGKSESDLSKIEKESAEERFRNYKNEEERLLRLQQRKGITVEQSAEINKQLLDNQKEYFGNLNKERISDLEGELSTVEAKRQAQKDLLKKIAEDKAKDRIEQARLQKEFEESLAKGLIDLQIATNEAEFSQRDSDIENRKRQSDEIAKIAAKEQADAEAEAEAEKKREETIANMKVGIRTNTQNLLLSLLKKGSAVAKGIAIAEIVREQVKSVSGAISNLTIANAKAVAASPLTGGQPFVGLNTALTVSGIAFSAATAAKSIKDILSDGKSASGASAPNSGSGGGEQPSAPSFNIVAGTGSNQIASGLASNKTPIRAFVVSSEQRTADALDRNIVSEASFG